MSWVTIIWAMGAGASLTLAFVHLLFWLRQRHAWASLLFTLMAASAAGLAWCEWSMLHAETTENYGIMLSWLHNVGWVTILSLVWIVRLSLRADRPWLVWSICVLRTLALGLNYISTPNIYFKSITALRQIPFLGETVAVPVGEPNPWVALPQFSMLLLSVYTIDSSVRAWRRGDRRLALTVGGSIILFTTLIIVQANLILWGGVPMPPTIGLFSMALVFAMGIELSLDMLRTAELAKALRVTESELRSSEERLMLAAAAANAGIWKLNQRTGKVWMSPKMEAIFGLTPKQEFTSQDWIDLIYPADQERMLEVKQAINPNQEMITEYRIVLPDGQVRWIRSHVRKVEDPAGQSQNLMGVSMDITEHKLKEDEINRQRLELSHIQRVASLGALSGSIAHEINQPLAIILTNAQAAQRLLAQDPADLAEVRDILDDIVCEDRRAGEVIRRMRNLLKRDEPAFRIVQFNDSVQEVLRLMRRELVDRRIAVSLQLEETLPRISGDRISLEQVMLNLISNACDAMAENQPKDRRLSISSGREGAKVRISVSDNGCGLPTDKALCFDAFFTTKPGGLGMGLPICLTIIEAHGGRLWGESNTVRGAVFHMEFPMAETVSPVDDAPAVSQELA
jgi:two-component system sensor kinase FixL